MNDSFNSIEKEADKMTELRYIDKKNSTFKRTEGGFVSAEICGESYDRVLVTRLFPFTNPDKFISIRTPNESSKEIGVIKDMKDVSKETREMLEEQLLLRYFTPIITKVIDIKDEYGYAYFHVVTDRGECRFTINMGSDSVVRLTETRLIISDLDENRFEIPDVTKLTVKEQKKLDLFL
ncbi:MAG: DUF1854 domain-containing protein [Eubacterium sp.]|nr:DUF1854 domain-containing protein [Eubacterium sp.]